MASTLALREALNASIASGHFADTKIYLFSHRNSAGDVCKPRALYTNSVVLKSVPYFNDLFSGNYSEAATKDLDDDTSDEGAIAEHYDYDSDSDLEDAEDLKPTEEPLPLLRGHPFDPFCFTSDENDGPESNNDSTADDKPQDMMCGEDHVPAYYEERMKEGKVIKVQDVAFITFQAFLFYLYTDHIDFAPFGSKANRKTRAAELVSLAPDCVPRPSPKSIYRLADKYDVPALKALALEEIREGVERCDAVRETFSRFSSHYPEILKMHVGNLASTLTKADSGEMQDQLDERLQAFAEGEIDHASEAFSSLWKAVTHSGGSTVSTPRRTGLGFFWEHFLGVGSAPLKIALIKSIRQGSFCDRRYLAKRDGSGRLRAPIHISSIVLGDTEPTLNTLIRDPRKGGAEYSEDECDSDSDYEDVMEGTIASAREDPGSHSEQESKPGLAATLSTGAFPTWRALFFFLYTGSVKFAPLKSQGLETRTHNVGENSRSHGPVLCSPKSICYVAGKLGFLHLESIALEDVTAKTSATNIVREAFSKSTARLPRVREMQCRLLVSSSRNKDIATAAEEQIRGLAGGQTPHRYTALSLGFRMAVEEKRRNPNTETAETEFPTGPTLQCPNSNCSQKGRPLFVREIGEETLCQTCTWRLKCYACGRFRKPGRPNCGGCRREWN